MVEVIKGIKFKVEVIKGVKFKVEVIKVIKFKAKVIKVEISCLKEDLFSWIHFLKL